MLTEVGEFGIDLVLDAPDYNSYAFISRFDLRANYVVISEFSCFADLYTKLVLEDSPYPKL